MQSRRPVYFLVALVSYSRHSRVLHTHNGFVIARTKSFTDRILTEVIQRITGSPIAPVTDPAIRLFTRGNAGNTSHCARTL